MACRPCRNAVGNCLEIGRLVLCDRVVHIGCGIAQDEADVLQTVVQVFVKTVRLSDFLNGTIVVDDILVAQNLDLAICHLDFHIFIQNPCAAVAACFYVLRTCVSADVKGVIPVRNVVAFDVQIIEKPVLFMLLQRRSAPAPIEY